jgi:hypothetical protein
MRTFRIGKNVTDFTAVSFIYFPSVIMVSVSIDSRLVLFHNLTILFHINLNASREK